MLSTQLALVALLVFLSCGVVLSAGDGLRFRAQTEDAPWPGRRMAFMRTLMGTIAFRSQDGDALRWTRPLMFTGGFLPEWNEDFNDVWLSSNSGKDWTLAAGVTYDNGMAYSPADSTSYSTAKENGGSFAMLSTDSSNTLYKLGQGSDVYTSTNAVSWRPVTQSTRTPYQGRNLGALTINSKGYLIRAGGQAQNERGQFEFVNDVVISQDGGRTWTVATQMAPFATRFTSLALSWISPQGDVEGKDITYVIAGRNTFDNQNDVWASSDDGRTWSPIAPAAPFWQRSSLGGAVTKDGLIIVTGGFADDSVGSFNRDVANDVWVSANGGYSWGRCVLDAEWEDRFQQAVAVDADGHLIIASGAVGADQQVPQKDVWRSLTSFHDLASVSRLCGVTIPSCGAGLKCWPGADTVVATDGSYVSCSACPTTSSGGAPGSTTNMAMVISLVVFVLLFVAAAAVAGFLYRKMRAVPSGLNAPYSTDSFSTMDNSGLMQHSSL